MLEHLSLRTRQLVEQLLSNKSVVLGGEPVGPFTEQEKSFLQLAAINLETLRGASGGSLLSTSATLYDGLEPFSIEVPDAIAQPSQNHGWKIGRMRTLSFRGIAPASHRWEHDFQTSSHLLYGPNGCGKSSLLGALCWCLTGCLFRDDCPPSGPEDIPVYSTDAKPKADGTRPDALSVLCIDGSTSSSTAPYLVELELVSTLHSPTSVWIRRHSEHGLEQSPDGDTWTKLDDLITIGITALDIELHALMPAKVAHLRFGKDNGILTLFSQLVGLDDLETISEVAGRCHTAMVKEANAIEKTTLKTSRDAVNQAVDKLKTMPEAVTELANYPANILPTRTDSTISAFFDEIEAKLKAARAQLAGDLGIEIPDPGAAGAAAVLDQLTLLPGHIDTAVSALAAPLSQLMASSLGRELSTLEVIKSTQAALVAFEESATEQATQRLQWAQREKESIKAGLLLLAAEHYVPATSECPVCEEPIPDDSNARSELVELQSLTGKPHLKQTLDDLQRALLAELDGIVSRKDREKAVIGLADQVKSDWTNLKGTRFLGLVRPIADQFDAAIEEAVALLVSSPSPINGLVGDELRNECPTAFKELEKEIAKARDAVQTAENFAVHYTALNNALSAILGDGAATLSSLLLRGKSTNLRIKDLTTASAISVSLINNQRKVDELAFQVQVLRTRAEATGGVKKLGDSVRQETISVVKAVEPLMKEFYHRLYDTEHLVLDMVTTGHAANPNVKDEFNIYLRAGTTRLPASPFANAGRLRALGLCFVFALQNRSTGTFSVVLLDDPAMAHPNKSATQHRKNSPRMSFGFFDML